MRAGTGARRRSPGSIAGIVAVVAILASIVVLNLARGGGDEPTPTAGPTTQAPTTTEAPKPTPTPSEKPETDKPDEDEAARRRCGGYLRLPHHAVECHLPVAGAPRWRNVRRLSGSGQRGAAAVGDALQLVPRRLRRDAYGVGRDVSPDGSFAVAKPASKCTAAPELYDEVWGLLNAWVGTIEGRLTGVSACRPACLPPCPACLPPCPACVPACPPALPRRERGVFARRCRFRGIWLGPEKTARVGRAGAGAGAVRVRCGRRARLARGSAEEARPQGERKRKPAKLTMSRIQCATMRAAPWP